MKLQKFDEFEKMTFKEIEGLGNEMLDRIQKISQKYPQYEKAYNLISTLWTSQTVWIGIVGLTFLVMKSKDDEEIKIFLDGFSDKEKMDKILNLRSQSN